MAKGFSKYLTKCISIVRCSIPHPNQIYPSQSIPYPLIVHGATPVYDVLSVSKQVKKERKLKGLPRKVNQMRFQNTLQNVFVSTQVTKELKNGRLSPEWRRSALSKYSTKFICFHTPHKMNSPECRLSAYSKYSTKFNCFHTRHKMNENWMAFT